MHVDASPSVSNYTDGESACDIPEEIDNSTCAASAFKPSSRTTFLESETVEGV